MKTAASAHSGASNSHPAFLPPEFRDLTEDQMQSINDLLRSKTYEEAQEQIQSQFGISISINKLFRYYQKLELAEALALAEDTAQGLQQLAQVYAGDPANLGQAGLEAIKRRALQLASSPSTKPSLLPHLLRIFTWEHRAAMNQHRKHIDLAKCAHRDRLAQLAERRTRFLERRAEAVERQAQFEIDCHATDLIKKAVLDENGGNLTAFISEDVRDFLRRVRPASRNKSR